jgi:hypothetical protein
MSTELPPLPESMEHALRKFGMECVYGDHAARVFSAHKVREEARAYAAAAVAAALEQQAAEIERLQHALYLAELDAAIAGTETGQYWRGQDEACAGVMGRWDEALTQPIPKPGTLGDEKMERLYRDTEALRKDAELWQGLYCRAVNAANGLTNYVEDRPELRRIERELEAIQKVARECAAIDAAMSTREGA